MAEAKEKKVKKEKTPRKKKYDYKYLIAGHLMECHKCKKQFGTRPDVYKRRWVAAGSEEALKNYECKDCRPKAEKKPKEPKAKKEKKAKE
jgi:hypothetical protein